MTRAGPVRHLRKQGEPLSILDGHAAVDAVLVTPASGWQDLGPRFAALRALAQAGSAVARCYLLPGRSFAQDAALREQLRLDGRAGVQTHVLDISDCLATLPEGVQALSFTLASDGTCTLYPAGAGGRPAVCAERVPGAAYTEVLRGFLEQAQRVDPAAAASPLAPELEPVALSAPLAYALAPTHCPRSGRDCSAYHSSWQYLRLFGLARTLQRQGGFYLERLRELAAEPARDRVLITGAADYSMLAHVLYAYAGAGAAPEVCVLDRCETPLELCRWYAQRTGTKVVTHCRSVLDGPRAGECFDVVCTHSLLGRFCAGERRELLRAWHAWLRPGGKVLTINRLTPGGNTGTAVYTPAAAEALLAKVARAARGWSLVLELDVEGLAAALQRYVASEQDHPLHSCEQVQALFEASGFRVDRAELTRLPATARTPVLPGSGQRDWAYVLVEATRR